MRTSKAYLQIKTRFSKLSWKGVPLSLFLQLLWESFSQGFLTQRAAAIAYNFFLSIFPFTIFMFTIIPYLPIEGFQESLLLLLSEVIPKSIFSIIQHTLFDIIAIKHSGLVSIGFITTFILSVNGVNALLTAFSSSYFYGAYTERSVIKSYLVATYITILQSVSMILIITLVVLNEVIINFIDTQISTHNMFAFINDMIQWLSSLFGSADGLVFMSQSIQLFLTFFLVYFNMSILIYKGHKRIKGRKIFSIGSMFSTLMFILISIGFQYYMTNFSSYNKLYGSIGILLAILFWFYLNSLAVLIGFEINTCLYVAKKRVSTLDK